MKKLIILSIFVVCVSINAFSTNRSSTGSGNWSTTTTWTPAGLPVAGDNITILSGHTVSVTGTEACANLTVSSGGNLKFTAATTLTVNGNYTLTGTESATSAGTLKFSGAGSTITVTGTVASIVNYYFNAACSISASSTISKPSATTTISNIGSVNNQGTYTMGNFTIEADAGAAKAHWTNTKTLTLNVNGFMVSGYGTFDASPSTNTVILNYATGNVPLTTAGYYNLTIQVIGTKTLQQNLVLAKTLGIATGVTLNSNNYNVTVGGNWSSTGTFTASAGHSVTFNGTTAQSITGGGTFEQITVAHTGTGAVSITSGSYVLNDVLTMTSGTFNTNGNSFTLISNATKTARIAPVASGCDIYGNFIIERYISGRSATWADLSSPVQASTFADWAAELTYVTYVDIPGGAVPTQFTWDESLNDFVSVTSSSTTLTPGVGFEVYLSGGFNYTTPLPNTTLTTVGVPTYGDQDFSSQIGYSPALSYSSNLVGNPFASSISWDAVHTASSNLDPLMDMFEASSGSYVDHNVGTGTVIGSTQGFWVYPTGSSPTLHIPESAKTSATTSDIRSNIDQKYFTLKISSADNSTPYYTTLKVGVSENATDGYDVGMDHCFRKSPLKETPAIYTTIGSAKSIIDIFNANDESYDMPISTTVGISGYYKIDANGFDKLGDYSCISLEDKLLNKIIDLKAQPTYSFRLNTGDNANRFLIHFRKSGNCRSVLGIDNISVSNYENNSQILPASFGNIINFNLNETTNTKITVVNLLGQTIIEPINVAAFNQSVNIYLPEGFSGLYLVKIESEKETIVKKFVK